MKSEQRPGIAEVKKNDRLARDTAKFKTKK